jgi:hypothetical protein
MNQHIQGIQKKEGLSVKGTVLTCLQKICLLDNLLVDAEKIGKEVFDKSWNRACILPKGGVHLDSM